MRDLSIFIDESGSDGLTDKYYLLTLVMHDQTDNLSNSIDSYERALVNKHLPNIPFHASPLMNGKGVYAPLDLRSRKILLGTFRVFFRHTPVSYHTFTYKTKEYSSLDNLAVTMRRDLINFLFDNLEKLQSYDIVKVYYDNGQRSIANSIHIAVEYALSTSAVVYRLAEPSEYRLAQVADYICTVEFTALKYSDHTFTATDEKFFGGWSDFKNGILKEVRKKLI